VEKPLGPATCALRGAPHRPHDRPASSWPTTAARLWTASTSSTSEPAKVTPHVLRATAITALLDVGTPLAEVQKWAGHVRPETESYWLPP
jgi:integrase